MPTGSPNHAPKRPLTVLLGLTLITGGLLWSVIETVTKSLRAADSSDALSAALNITKSPAAACIFAAFMLTFLLLYYKIWQGRNWARKLHLIIEVSSIILITGILQEPVESYYQAADILGLALLFWPTSSAWFKAMEATKKPPLQTKTSPLKTTMSYNKKLDLALKELETSPIWRPDYNSPSFRLLRSFGIKIAPPHYRSFRFNFVFFSLVNAIIFAALNAPAGWVVAEHGPVTERFVNILFGISLALIESYHYSKNASKHGLTPWSKLEPAN